MTPRKRISSSVLTEKPEASGLTIGDTIRRIEQTGSWAALKNIEQVPEYAALLADLLGEIQPEIEAKTGRETRVAIPGHTQRGGTPVAADRVLGTWLGSHAMTLLREGKVGRMVAVQNGRLTDIDLEEPAGKQRLVPVDDPLIDAARAVGTIFGD